MIKFRLGAARYRRLWPVVAGVAMTTGMIAAARYNGGRSSSRVPSARNSGEQAGRCQGPTYGAPAVSRSPRGQNVDVELVALRVGHAPPLETF